MMCLFYTLDYSQAHLSEGVKDKWALVLNYILFPNSI